MDDPITSHSDSQAVALLSVLTPIDELPLFKGDLTQEEKNTALHELVQWERAPSTFKTYLSQVRAWAVWARQKDVRVIPADPVEICSWLEYRAHDRKTKHSLSTLKQACAALVVAHTLYDSKALNPAQSELVKRMIRSLTNEKGAYQKSATGLTATDLAAITATACRPRRGIFGRLESARNRLEEGVGGHCPYTRHAGRDAETIRSGRPLLAGPVSRNEGHRDNSGGPVQNRPAWPGSHAISEPSHP